MKRVRAARCVRAWTAGSRARGGRCWGRPGVIRRRGGAVSSGHRRGEGFAFFLGLSTMLDVFMTYFFTRPLVVLLGRNDRLTAGRFGVSRGLRSRRRSTSEPDRALQPEPGRPQDHGRRAGRAAGRGPRRTRTSSQTTRSRPRSLRRRAGGGSRPPAHAPPTERQRPRPPCLHTHVPGDTKFDFVGRRRWWFLLSASSSWPASSRSYPRPQPRHRLQGRDVLDVLAPHVTQTQAQTAVEAAGLSNPTVEILGSDTVRSPMT